MTELEKRLEENDIHFIMNFPLVQIEIDFNEPLMSQNKMIAMVDEMEKNSPVGQVFGIDGNIGEGYVFTFEFNGEINRFKVKGDLHSSGKGGTYQVNTKGDIVTVNGKIPSKELQEELRKQLGEGIYNFSL